MKITNTKNLLVHAASCIFFLFSCFYMYDFYKCLSGFIANGFREADIMLPMVLSFLLPVLCFLVFFYDFYVKRINNITNIVLRMFFIIYGTLNLVFIFGNLELYASNNTLGVYSSLPSFGVHFPYDMIAIHIAIIVFLVISLVLNKKAAMFIGELRQHGIFKINSFVYVALCLFAIFAFVFVGSAITASFTSYENALHDAKFIFLVIWVLFVPIMNLLFLAKKPQSIATLAFGIGVNLAFGVLLFIFEYTSPDFMVHIGKPLFLIAFSVSLPIEMAIIVLMMTIGTVYMTFKLISELSKKKQS